MHIIVSLMLIPLGVALIVMPLRWRRSVRAAGGWGYNARNIVIALVGLGLNCVYMGVSILHDPPWG